ncbi:metallophosphoesterase family protein [Desulforhopalus vacuolatus]|uniref:metallophosphoesterase family protein n=1 Tax=Desulforhopalus vacuolatus TaxID=40414 RepID=UPI001962F161|nr:YfcE family phosphodiesterase [Desulforhopalus vacuolatus]MBM9519892.1 metallophosphoesterase family protein [Desulforhopalus vacuolatus]
MKILLLADIHSNFPALSAVGRAFAPATFEAVLNCGDSLVYAPFYNETVEWLRDHHAISILGNTDRKVIKLLKGKDFKKPSNKEKRMMYLRAAEELNTKNTTWLLGLKKEKKLKISGREIALYHGSPDDPDEFLFNTTPDARFLQLAEKMRRKGISIVVTGHSHTPYVKKLGGVWFINPGSTGRMFDGDPRLSCAVLQLTGAEVRVTPHRLEYDVEAVVKRLQQEGYPPVYKDMYRLGRKLN